MLATTVILIITFVICVAYFSSRVRFDDGFGGNVAIRCNGGFRMPGVGTCIENELVGQGKGRVGYAVSDGISTAGANSCRVGMATRCNGGATARAVGIRIESGGTPRVALGNSTRVAMRTNDRFDSPKCATASGCSKSLANGMSIAKTISASGPKSCRVGCDITSSSGGRDRIGEAIRIASDATPRVGLSNSSFVSIGGNSGCDSPKCATASGYSKSVASDIGMSKSGMSGSGTKGCAIACRISSSSKGGTATAEIMDICSPTTATSAMGPNGGVVCLAFSSNPKGCARKLLSILSGCGMGTAFFIAGARPSCRGVVTRRTGEKRAITVRSTDRGCGRVCADRRTFFSSLRRVGDVVGTRAKGSTSVVEFPNNSSGAMDGSCYPNVVARLMGSIATEKLLCYS